MVHWLSLAMRGAGILVVVFVAWCTVNDLRKLCWPTLTQVEYVAIKDYPPPVSLAGIFASQPEAGYWTFGDWKWRVGQKFVISSQLEEVFERAAQTPLSADAAIEAGELDLIEALHHLPGDVRRDGRRWCYVFKSPSLRLQVVLAEHTDGQQLHSAVFAFLADDDRWRVWEILPAPERVEQVATNSGGNLLPMPRRSTPIVGRWSTDGQLLFEIISTEANLNDLMGEWETAGWQVDRQFASIDEALLCKRAGLQIYVWTPDRGPLVRTVMLAPVTSHSSLDDTRAIADRNTP